MFVIALPRVKRTYASDLNNINTPHFKKQTCLLLINTSILKTKQNKKQKKGLALYNSFGKHISQINYCSGQVAEGGHYEM